MSEHRTLESLREAAERFANRHERRRQPTTPDQSAYIADYWERVYNPNQYTEQPKAPAFVQQMDYREARLKFRDVLEARADEITRLENRPFDWIFDGNLRDVIRNTLMYFINDPASAYPLGKGLYWWGGFGCGKTELMQCFSVFTKANNLQKQFEFSSLSDEYIIAGNDPKYDPIAQNMYFNRCFDELGRQTGAIQCYGNMKDINEAIIEGRYRRWKQAGKQTHFVSNANPNEVLKLFTGAAADRLTEMVTSIEVVGASKRRNR